VQSGTIRALTLVNLRNDTTHSQSKAQTTALGRRELVGTPLKDIDGHGEDALGRGNRVGDLVGKVDMLASEDEGERVGGRHAKGC
jgi:hypothetical protein